MAWVDSLPVLSRASLATLASWALGHKAAVLDDEFVAPEIADEALASGPAGVIDYALEHFAWTDAGQFWNTLKDTGQTDNHAARKVSNGFFQSTDWRPGFATAALRALDTRSALDTDGILLGLEVARGLLLHPGCVAQIKLKADLAEGGNLDTPLLPRQSPFSDPVVREVLTCMDAVVAAQEQQVDRAPMVFQDMQRFGPEPLKLVGIAQAQFKTSALGMAGSIGSRVVTLLRALMEEALNRQQLDVVKAIDANLVVLAARYGFTRDCLHAAHRCAFTNAMVHGDMATAATVAIALEHFLAGALWLSDPELEATVHHGLALMLRNGARKMPGAMDAIPHFQRSMTLRRQLNEKLAALGTQIDLSSVLIELGPFAGLLADAPPEVEKWRVAADAYLEDAIDQLADQTNPVARGYLGEAFCNRARLHMVIGKKAGAAEYAQAALAISEETGNQDLKARALLVLGQAEQAPARALDYQAAAARVVQAVRKNIADEQITVAWVGNKEGLFDAQLAYILTHGREVMGEEAVCRAFIDALEEGRALTYNRWLGIEKNADLDGATAALQAAPETVLAIYAVTPRQVGLVLLAADEPPRLHLIEIGAHQVDHIAEQHLAALDLQSWTRLPLWDDVQSDFIAAATLLVAPLEEAAAAGKTICIIPHRGLHALGLHAVPTAPGGLSIGLRTPVFCNPSITNWLNACRDAHSAAEDNSCEACVAGAWPLADQENSGEIAAVANALQAGGLAVKRLSGTAADLPSLANGGSAWRVLHLGCHGIFRDERPMYGLLLAAHDQPPPPPVSEIRDEETYSFLATPAKLRTARLSGQLTFLSSCVSARSFAMPGDDLIGITRALFANGALDLIAGGWTVLSSVVEEFAHAFYDSLRAGQSTAAALLTARQHLAKTNPDPFFWGCFILQGANTYPLRSDKT